MGNPQKLHIGCGTAAIPGWVNIDIADLPGVDLVLDVRAGLPSDGVDLIFAEHFIEHLDADAGLRFLMECRRALGDSGVLRLSTPNLDWVWRHQCHWGAWLNDREAIRDCLWMNRAFHGWGHRFLYNRQTLEQALRTSGFSTITAAAYGESRHPDMRGLERHERYVDSPETPHVIILEAMGCSGTPSGSLRAQSEDAGTPSSARRQEGGCERVCRLCAL